MPAKRKKPATTPKDSRSYVFQVEGKEFRLTYEQAFSYGHTLMEGGHFAQAVQLFSRLAKIPGRGPRARIMLSRCAIGLDKYAVCQEILKIAFDGQDQAVVEVLQSAFVYHKMGMQADAIRAMTDVVQKYENLPTACLLLGDMFAAEGQLQKAAYCWELAVRRDRPRGAVAQTARKQLANLKKPQQKTNERAQRVE